VATASRPVIESTAPEALAADVALLEKRDRPLRGARVARVPRRKRRPAP
jgi:hypothetical protein